MGRPYFDLRISPAANGHVVHAKLQGGNVWCEPYIVPEGEKLGDYIEAALVSGRMEADCEEAEKRWMAQGRNSNISNSLANSYNPLGLCATAAEQKIRIELAIQQMKATTDHLALSPKIVSMADIDQHLYSDEELAQRAANKPGL